MSSRLRAVRIFTLSYEKLMFLVRHPSRALPLRTCHRALACAACSFLNKTALSPRRRAHFAFKLALEQSYCQFAPKSGSQGQVWLGHDRKRQKIYCVQAKNRNASQYNIRVHARRGSYATHVQPRAGTHVVLEVALAAHLGAICCRRHRGGADPGARGAARPAASLHKVFPFT